MSGNANILLAPERNYSARGVSYFSTPLNCGQISVSYRTLLKSDQWLSESHSVEVAVRGAINFRRVVDTQVYALGQPTIEAIDEVLRRVQDSRVALGTQKIVWVTLREEPIVYIVSFNLERLTTSPLKDISTRMEHHSACGGKVSR